ncbi:MAG: hypothetical protein K8F90_18540, partial [Hyphomicrobiales bacterium]|nr:hypothetical protein [Hyphomicrobiales bacterium]
LPQRNRIKPGYSSAINLSNHFRMLQIQKTLKFNSCSRPETGTHIAVNESRFLILFNTVDQISCAARLQTKPKI